MNRRPFGLETSITTGTNSAETADENLAELLASSLKSSHFTNRYGYVADSL